LIRGLRATLRDVVAAAGITTRIVPHQFRHTYGTEMMRRRQLPRSHAITRSHRPRNDSALSRDHSTRSAT
jgi:integrase